MRPGPTVPTKKSAWQSALRTVTLLTRSLRARTVRERFGESSEPVRRITTGIYWRHRAFMVSGGNIHTTGGLMNEAVRVVHRLSGFVDVSVRHTMNALSARESKSKPAK